MAKRLIDFFEKIYINNFGKDEIKIYYQDISEKDNLFKMGKYCYIGKPQKIIEMPILLAEGNTDEECLNNIDLVAWNLIINNKNEIEEINNHCDAYNINKKYGVRIKQTREPFLFLYISDTRFDSVSIKYYIHYSIMVTDINNIKLYGE